jgi:GNAT superfamily N-acetyltransferase
LNGNVAELLHITKADIEPAAVTLAQAFHEYPLIKWFTPDAEKRLESQPKAFRGMVRGGIRYGEVYATSTKMEGIAIWYFPGDQWMIPQRKFSLRRRFALLFANKERMKRGQSFADYANDVRKRLVPGKHFYLQVLGVAPVFQGRGYSSRLLKPMLARADRAGLPCFLETQAEKNVKLYEHFGFRVAEEGKIPGGDVVSWAMVRENKMSNDR